MSMTARSALAGQSGDQTNDDETGREPLSRRLMSRGLTSEADKDAGGAINRPRAETHTQDTSQDPSGTAPPTSAAPRGDSGTPAAEHTGTTIAEADMMQYEADSGPAQTPANTNFTARITADLYTLRHDVRPELGIILRAATVALTMFLVALFARSVAAHEDHRPEPGRIAITGVGKVEGAPDMAIITSGVVTSAATAREAVAANTEAMTTIVQRLKSLGIEDRDLQTSGFSINPQYQHFRPREGQPAPPPQIVAYEVRNSLTIRIRDLPATGTILDTLVSDGANQINGISFTIADPKPLMKTARERAVADARARAEALAESLGVSLGRVLSISEGQVQPPVPQPRMARMEMAMAADSAPVPVEAGEQTLTAHVSIVWVLDQ